MNSKQSKDRKVSKVYIIASYEREGSDFQIIEASENFDDIEEILSRNNLIEMRLNQENPITRELLERRGKINLDYSNECDRDQCEFDLEYYPVIAVALDMEIPDNREAYALCGNGDEWSWEGDIKALYPTVEEAWEKLAKDNEIDEEEGYDYRSYDEVKDGFINNCFFWDNLSIYWSWIKIFIKG